jgi:hypothetical protein
MGEVDFCADRMSVVDCLGAAVIEMPDDLARQR